MYIYIYICIYVYMNIYLYIFIYIYQEECSKVERFFRAKMDDIGAESIDLTKLMSQIDSKVDTSGVLQRVLKCVLQCVAVCREHRLDETHVVDRFRS